MKEGVKQLLIKNNILNVIILIMTNMLKIKSEIFYKI